MHLEEIKSKCPEFNLFYKHVTYRREVLINKRKIIIILQKLKNN